MHHENCFITLTYNDDHLPSDEGLHYEHFQKFMKRLRYHFSKKNIRFYMCGEYGRNPDGTLGRPHYHAILFGVKFDDLVELGKHSYSPTLEKLWPFGFNTVGDVTLQSARYVAGYIFKKQTGDKGKDYYTKVDPYTGEIIPVTPEFTRMSLKPGIGATWYETFGQETHDHDFVVSQGKQLPVPKYYDKLLEKEDETFLEFRKEIRKLEYDRFRSKFDSDDAFEKYMQASYNSHSQRLSENNKRKLN